MNLLNNVRVILIFFSTFIFCNTAFPSRVIWKSSIESRDVNLIKFFDCDPDRYPTSGFIVVSDAVMKPKEIESIIKDQCKDDFDIYSVVTIDDKSYISLLPKGLPEGCDDWSEAARRSKDKSFVKTFFGNYISLLNSIFNLIKFRDNSQDGYCLKSVESSAVIINENNYNLYSEYIARIRSNIQINPATHHIAVIESDSLGQSPFYIFEERISDYKTLYSFRKLYQVIDKKRVIVFIEKQEQLHISFTAIISGLFGYIVDGKRNGITYVSGDRFISGREIRNRNFDMKMSVEYVQSRLDKELHKIDDPSQYKALDKNDDAFWSVISKFMGFQPEPDSDSDSDSWG